MRDAAGGSGFVDHHCVDPAAYQLRVAGFGDGEYRICLPQNRFDTSVRQRDIDRQIGATGGEYGQDGDDGIRRARQHQRNDFFRSYAPFGQLPREPASVRV